MKLKLFTGAEVEEEIAIVKVYEVGGGIRMVLTDRFGNTVKDPYILTLRVRDGLLEVERMRHVNPRFVRLDLESKISTS